jgi:HTH-type transcriptional regulator / antitoxin HipB
MVDRMEPAASELVARVHAMARAIRARRKALRLTQIELSRLCGCGPDFVYDVENGKPSLRLDKLLELLRVLGLELVLAEGKDTLRVATSIAPAGGTTGPNTARPKRTARRS